MSEILFLEEKNVKNVTITGNRVSFYGEIVSGSDGVLKTFSGRVQDNQDAEIAVGNVYYMVSQSPQIDTVTSYVNVLPEYYLDSLELFTQSMREILGRKA